MDTDVVGADITREEMANLWSTKELFGRGERELLVWHHRLNHCSFKYLLRLSKRLINTRKLIRFRNLPPLYLLSILEVAQVTMDDQRQKIRWVTQESLGDQTRGIDFGLSYGFCQTRYHSPSHWVSNPCKIIGIQCIYGPLIQLLICSPRKGNLSWGKPLVQESLRAPGIYPRVQGLRLQGRQGNNQIYPVQGGVPDLWTIEKLLRGDLSPSKCNFWLQDQVIDPS